MKHCRRGYGLTGGLSVWHWSHGTELVPAPGTLPGCLKLWGPGRGPTLGRGDKAIKDGPSAGTPQLHVAARAMDDGEKPGQMCLLEAEITSDPFPTTSFSLNCPLHNTQGCPGQAGGDGVMQVWVGVGGHPASTGLNKDKQEIGTGLGTPGWSHT